VRDSVGQSRACRSYVSLRGHSMPRYLQRMVEPNFQRGAFVEAEIAVCQESRYRADGCSDAGADGSTASAASHCTANCAHTGACACSFDLVPLIHAAAFDLAFFVRRFDAVFARNAGHCCDQRNPSMTGFDLVETEQQARMKAVLHSAHMTFD